MNRILKEKQARNQNNSERINNYRLKQQSVDAKATRAKEGASGKSDAVRNQTSTNLLSQSKTSHIIQNKNEQRKPETKQ